MLLIMWLNMEEKLPGHSVNYAADEWAEMKSGNKTALEAVYRMFYPVLFNYGLKLKKDEDIVRDCIHDLFYDIWTRREKISIPNSVKVYLLVSLKRRILKESDYIHSPNLVLENAFDVVDSYENQIIKEKDELDKVEILTKTINKLPKRQKEILYLRFYEGLSCDEITGIMSLTKNSTYVLLSQSITALRSALEKINNNWIALITLCLL